MLELVCATSNPNKLLEFQQASGSDVLVRGCEPRDCPETADSFEGNALQKALCYSRGNNSEWLFADDSGLVVDALAGAPGVHSARFAGEPANYAANNRLLLRRLAGVRRRDRQARFVCCIALLHRGSLAATFRGEVEGLILQRESGKQGFGYDPLFYYPRLRTSFGRLPREEKWNHSHRGRAYRAMLRWIQAQS